MAKFKLVPFQFYIMWDIEDFLTVLETKEEIDFTKSSGTNIIWKIKSFSYNKIDEKLFIYLIANDINETEKDIINNQNKWEVWILKENQTSTNNYTIVLDFGASSKFESFGDEDDNVRWLMYVIYNWHYSIVSSLMSYFEEIFKDKLNQISNFHTNDQLLRNVKEYIEQVELKLLYQYDNIKWEVKHKSIWSFVTNARQIYSIDNTDKDYKSDVYQKSLTDSINNLVEIAWNSYQSIKENIVTKIYVKAKWKNREIDDTSMWYVIKDFPQEQELPDSWQDLNYSIVKRVRQWQSIDDDLKKLYASLEIIKEKLFNNQ